jgi:hypothetical protein
MLKEDNSGFVNFPLGNPFFSRKNGKTFIYLVAFDQSDIMNQAYILSNSRLTCPGDYVTDDISGRYQNLNSGEREGGYFPNDQESIPLTTCICIGWSENTYDFKENLTPWYATFRDLTPEGRKLYYSIKKLHNNKEVRILTFNNI